jgi:hypothetical protein
MILTGENRSTARKICLSVIFQTQILHGLTWDRTRASAVRGCLRHSSNTPVSVIKTNQLMPYSEIIAVCSQIHVKHINTLCGHIF